jgi:hypothetical protein
MSRRRWMADVLTDEADAGANGTDHGVSIIERSANAVVGFHPRSRPMQRR